MGAAEAGMQTRGNRTTTAKKASVDREARRIETIRTESFLAYIAANVPDAHSRRFQKTNGVDLAASPGSIREAQVGGLRAVVRLRAVARGVPERSGRRG